MPTFIKKIGEANRDWTHDELVTIYQGNPSRFITVPETHAADVLRPQGKYQEVDTDVLQVQAADVSVVQPQQSSSRRKTRRKVKPAVSDDSSG